MAANRTKSFFGFLTELDERKKLLLMGLVLALITFAVFAPAIRFGFINYDDNRYVFENHHVLGGLSWSGLRYAFGTIDMGNWMPLTWLSLELDATLFGSWPAGYHFTSILLHCGSVVLLFLALERMTKAFWCSALVALLFAIHPLRQESVVWIAERKGVLSTFFWMLGLLAYARYAEKRSRLRYGAVALCLVLGLLSKAMLIMFPFALLLLDFWPLQRFGRDPAEWRVKFWPLLLEKVPLLLPCGAMLAITYWTQDHAGAIGAAPASIIGKILHVCSDYTIYLRHTFWPAHLAIPYPMKIVSWPYAILSSGLVAGISIASLYLARSLPWLIVGWLWYLVTFVPVIGFIQISDVFVADRYSYVPFIGVAVMVAWGMGALTEKFPAGRKAVILASLGLCFATAAVNRTTLFRWKNSVTLFSDSVKQGLHPTACNNLAAALNSRGEYAKALPYAKLAIKLRRNKPMRYGYINCGMAHEGLGDYNQAIQDYSTALKLDPRSSKAYQDRGSTFVDKRDFEAALSDYTHAIELNPDSVALWKSRAFVWCSLSNYDAALSDFTHAIALSPHSAEIWDSRAFVWCSLSNYDAALSDCARAVQLDPHNANSYVARGNVFSKMGDYRRAVADYSLAIKLKAKFAIAYNDRAAAYLGLKEPAKAEADIRSCERLGGRPSSNLIQALSNGFVAKAIPRSIQKQK